MTKGKSKKHPSKKELSEGKTIALAVLVITGGLAGAVYLIKLIIGFFFPGFVN